MTFIPNDPRINRKGRPKTKSNRMTELRHELHESMTIEEITAVKDSILKKAINGDIGACKLFLEYSIGKPIQVNYDHIYNYTGEANSFDFNEVIRKLRGDE